MTHEKTWIFTVYHIPSAENSEEEPVLERPGIRRKKQ
jgi:hypothetical protein